MTDRQSIVFAQKRWNIIDHLRNNVYQNNQARAMNLYQKMVGELIKEMGGVETRHTLVKTGENGEKRLVDVKVVKFPDNSVARRPMPRDLEKEKPFISKTDEIRQLLHAVIDSQASA